MPQKNVAENEVSHLNSVTAEGRRAAVHQMLCYRIEQITRLVEGVPSLEPYDVLRRAAEADLEAFVVRC
jgi:hypothetical protein